MNLIEQKLPFLAMGSPCEIILFGEDQARTKRASIAAMKEVMRLEQKYSRYRKGSFLSTINRIAACGGQINLDLETGKLMDVAFSTFNDSDGLFDITSGLLKRHWHDRMLRVPSEMELRETLAQIGLDKVNWKFPTITFATQGMSLDLGGIAKEYAVDRAAAICQEAGLQHGLISLGGDIFVIGPRPDSTPWHIGIRNPFGGPEAFVTLFVHKGGLATSGSYERYWEIGDRRYSHIINPKTGWPVEGLPSVTVLADSCLKAGVAATTALLVGSDWHHKLDSTGLNYLGIGQDKKVVSNFDIARHHSSQTVDEFPERN